MSEYTDNLVADALDANSGWTHDYAFDPEVHADVDHLRQILDRVDVALRKAGIDAGSSEAVLKTLIEQGRVSYEQRLAMRRYLT